MNTSVSTFYPGLRLSKCLAAALIDPHSMLRITAERDADWEHVRTDVFGEEFLLERPLLKAVRSTDPVVLLVDELDKKGQKFGVTQGALVSLDASGAIHALVGGRNYADSQFNRAVDARRQAGSSSMRSVANTTDGASSRSASVT